MTGDQVSERIKDILTRIITEKGLAVPAIGPTTTFLGGDLPTDSLDLATLVVELTLEIGRDPFRDGFINFTTVSELAKLYAE